MDKIFSTRQLQEKCVEQHVPLYQVFVHLTKAVNRDALWKINRKVGCPPTFVNMFKQLHRNTKARVTFNGSLLDAISVDNVKEGEIPAPTMLSRTVTLTSIYGSELQEKYSIREGVMPDLRILKR